MKKKKTSDTLMHCPLCKKHCSLAKPHCKKGEKYAHKLKDNESSKKASSKKSS